MSLITYVGSEFQPLFLRTLLGSAIVSASVPEERGGALAGMEDWTIMCGRGWRSEYVLREVDR
jgi:hypothetical protein